MKQDEVWKYNTYHFRMENSKCIENSPFFISNF